MKLVRFTEFRKHASGLFSEVEGGETLIVLRHGKPIAEISPVGLAGQKGSAWKRPGLRLASKGAGLAAAILEERERS